jgi:hypothetical protein
MVDEKIKIRKNKKIILQNRSLKENTNMSF